MLSPSPSSANIYVAFEHDDVKIFNVLSKTYQYLNIQEKNQLTILINCFLEKNQKELWIGTDSGLFIYDLDLGTCKRIRQGPLVPMHYPAILSQPCLKTAKTGSGYASTRTE